MPGLSTRLARLEREFGIRREQKCPLCLSGGVWRTRINGERQLHLDDPVFDESWHCRRCGAAASEVNVVTPMGSKSESDQLQ
jgi:hypothetical protein